jgi:hypothetical protein
MKTISKDYATPHLATTYQKVLRSRQRPIVELDMQFSGIQLSDDLSHMSGVLKYKKMIFQDPLPLKKLVQACDGELNKNKLQIKLKLKQRDNFTVNYLKAAIQELLSK